MIPPAPAAPGAAPEVAEHDRGRARAAADAAQRRYPGPVGEHLARDLQAWAAFGYSIGYGPAGRRPPILQLIDELLR